MTSTDHAPARRGLPTSYAGHVFRSRLEARFAVLFDEMGIRWEYEPEGFDLPTGLYVPDFWLPDLRTWIEVKPDGECALEERPWMLANELAIETRKPVCIAPGIDYAGVGAPTFFGLRYPHSEGWRRAETGYFSEVCGATTIAYLSEPVVGPSLLMSTRIRAATGAAKAATFERPSRIAAYPLVAGPAQARPVRTSPRINLEDVLS